MTKVSILIENDLSKSKTQTIIEAVSQSFEGETLAKAIGKAMTFAFNTINSQYDAPRVVIGGYQLTDADAKKFRTSDFFAFDLSFRSIRETIFAVLSSTDEESKANYIRTTDVRGYYVNTKSFSNEQFAAQAKERIRAVKDAARFAKMDAVNSAVPEDILERRAKLTEQARLKRIEAKAQAQLTA